MYGKGPSTANTIVRYSSLMEHNIFYQKLTMILINTEVIQIDNVVIRYIISS